MKRKLLLAGSIMLISMCVWLLFFAGPTAKSAVDTYKKLNVQSQAVANNIVNQENPQETARAIAPSGPQSASNTSEPASVLSDEEFARKIVDLKKQKVIAQLQSEIAKYKKDSGEGIVSKKGDLSPSLPQSGQLPKQPKDSGIAGQVPPPLPGITGQSADLPQVLAINYSSQTAIMRIGRQIFNVSEGMKVNASLLVKTISPDCVTITLRGDSAVLFPNMKTGEQAVATKGKEDSK